MIGNVGGDPDVRTTASGNRVAKLSLATSRSFPDRSGQQQERTEWHRLTIFGRLVDVVEQWVKKGDRLYVEGRIEYSQSTDPQGNVRYWTDVIVDQLIMLGSSGARGGGPVGDDPAHPPGGGHPGQGGQGSAPPIAEPDDDLPF